MNPNDDDRFYNDENSDLFPNAGQRISSHNFYGDPVVPPQQQQYQQKESNGLDDYCPQCDAQLEIRESTLGKYISCTRFPECRYTRPYEDTYEHAAPSQQDYSQDEETVEKDYLKEAANEMSGYGYHDEPDEISHTYEEQTNDEAYEDEVTQRDEVEDPAAAAESYIEPKEETSEPSFEPSIYGKNMSEPHEENYEEQASPIEEPQPREESKPAEPKPTISSYGNSDRSILLNHPGFLKKEEVSNSSRWAELKQKRLRDQRIAAQVPVQAPGELHVPSPEELEEALKSLEANVQKLQNDEGQQIASQNQQQTHSTKNYADEYDDDLLPPSLRQALREKNND